MSLLFHCSNEEEGEGRHHLEAEDPHLEDEGHHPEEEDLHRAGEDLRHKMEVDLVNLDKV